MKTGKLLLGSVMCLSLIAISCRKGTDELQNPSGAESLAELQIDQSFNWSSSIKGELIVDFEKPDYLDINGQVLELIDKSGEILSQSVITNNQAEFQLSLPQHGQNFYLRYPPTGELMVIDRVGKLKFSLSAIDLENDLGPKGTHKSVSMGGTFGPNLLDNGEFDQALGPIDASGTSSLRAQGQWFKNDIGANISQLNGNNVFTSSRNGRSKIFQSLAINSNHIYKLSFDFSGGASVILYFFNQSGILVGYQWPSRNANSGEAEIQVSQGIAYVQVMAYASANDWIDNVSVSMLQEPDTDGDGVVDRLDDYPQDSEKAFASFYPQVGRQVLAFEDNWPNVGDYDLNDMVLANLVEYASDASGKLVEAKFKIQVNAVGTGYPAGLGVVFKDDQLNDIQANIIESINGHADSDPDVNNGVVVFDHVFWAMDNPYRNNGRGPDGEPEEFEFTVVFNANVTGINLVPDIYTFRYKDRGREVHLSGFGPTSASDQSYLNTGDDVNGTYKTANGLPWVIEVVYPGTIFFKHPLERVDICLAYPYFQEWAESNGQAKVGWMISPDPTKVYEFK